MNYSVDLHVHIGQAKNKPVKITASRQLTLRNIFDFCLNKKGIDIVGIVDSASPLVLKELRELVQEGLLKEKKNGGLDYGQCLTIILGSEIETEELNGAAHSIAYFPYYEQMHEFSKIMSGYVTNVNLSSQKARLSAYELEDIVSELGGILLPAHIFTPFKSFYSCYNRLEHAFSGKFEKISAVELGLSADTYLADRISELSGKVFLSNSDAHSLQKIAREYTIMQLEKPNFKNIAKALRREGKENKVVANYGLDPKLGKYHRTRCKECESIESGYAPKVKCSSCNSRDVVIGVLDKVALIADNSNSVHPTNRPPYYYQIPLEFIPGVGKKTIEKLIESFENEMNVIHNISQDQLSEVVSTKVAKNIVLGRQGKLSIQTGGGGLYGKVIP